MAETTELTAVEEDTPSPEVIATTREGNTTFLTAKAGGLSQEEVVEAIQRMRDEGGMSVDLGGDSNSDDEEGVLSVEQAIDLLTVVSEMRGDSPQKLKPAARWAKMGGMYTLVGETVEKLQPGYYDTEVNNGQLFIVPVAQRLDKILRFPHANTERILDGIERFWTREDVFKEFGMPYKRGILMFGPPGSGKTSALQLIARDVVDRGGIVLIFDVDTFMSAYRHIRRVQPETPLVVLMEDLDAILERRESTILNMLDGAEKMDKVVFVATTNYPENLGPRIINRPSRFDMRVFVDHPNDVGRKMYLEHLLEGHDVEGQFDFDRYVKDTKGMSLAHLKELFVSTVVLGVEYGEALKHLTEMHLDRPTSKDDDKSFKPEPKTGQYV